MTEIHHPLLLAAGACGLAVACILARAIRRDVRSWIPVVGRVGLFVASGDAGPDRVVRFEFPAGVERYTSAVAAGDRSRGDPIRLRVNPADPQEVVEESSWVTYTMPGFVGLLSIGLAVMAFVEKVW